MTKPFISKGRGIKAAACLVAGLFAIPTLASSASNKTEETFQFLKKVSIPGLESFDISWVDKTMQSYFLADRSNKSIDVINTSSLSLTAQYQAGFAGAVLVNGKVNNDISGPNGVLTLHNQGGKQIWVGDGPTVAPNATFCAQNAFNPNPTAQFPLVPLTGKCSTAKVLDAGGTLIHTISTNGAKRADELCFDPKDNLILIANDADSPPFISFISTASYKVVKQISIPEATNGIEQCQWSERTGMFYLNIPEVNGSGSDTEDGSVYVYEPKDVLAGSTTPEKKFDISITNTGCAGPQGMAFGPDDQILLGCHGEPGSIIIDQDNGGLIAKLPDMGGADEVWFNSADAHYFIASSSDVEESNESDKCPSTFVHPHEINVVDSRTQQADQTICVDSAASPHSVAADPVRKNAFVPISEGVNVFAPVGHDDRPAFVRRNQNDQNENN